ncbi:ribulose-phosphate 3-epimerase [Desulfobotulus alkaliphilus]|uniref:Ribulose-phosphate 3-epimerase n=1 Tax=Desulfobotulus alkaliphilus TaxID=622671 RepID=A0A562RQJ0_9BACT|nr:ribulose-phosphate 3-epimerase [Desulfobotulus alkaliphilus]TWI71203.1 ribulose-phosphate 3-epimerase [Desulfobotulus alkaliphilus]
MKHLIAPSILSADFTRLGEEIRAVESAGADWIHIDVMDGRFVPNISYGPIIVEAARKCTNLPLDVHLMIVEPDAIIPAFVKAGADLVSVHAETCPHLHRSIQLIRSLGAKPGVALNPGTPPEMLDYVMDDIDFILVMTVNPGFGGQKFIPRCLDKIARIRERIVRSGRPVHLQVDGGINPDTLKQVSMAGADVLVAGSAIFQTEDYKKTIEEFHHILRRDPDRGL